MPLLLESHDYLPNLDSVPTESDLSAARELIVSNLSPEVTSDPSQLHPSIPNLSYEPQFPILLSETHKHLDQTSGKSSRDQSTGIDTTRYEALSPPDPPSFAAWSNTLKTAYTSLTHLQGRATNLSLLEKYGKNAWLVSNDQLEAELRSLEREVKEVEGHIEVVERERRQKQENVGGELEGLRETWRETLGRAVEAEIASEELRRRIATKRRG